mmetsp:Transcript_45479/g.67564  ORF Transcript_45479/g.67564 Transcript_45479/m.67564 type:complete len:621 (-) Transcript_45479:249-2111(-)
MSTLEYLDPGGNVNFTLVPWKVLNNWLSALNGNTHATNAPPEYLNRGKVIEELVFRRDKLYRIRKNVGRLLGRDLGFGKDWRLHIGEQGFTHLEELLIYRPTDWRKQAREYLFKYEWDLDNVGIAFDDSRIEQLRTVSKSIETDDSTEIVTILMKTPILVVLFHPEMPRTSRYEPLQFLLAYSAQGSLQHLVEALDLDPQSQAALLEELSPLDYFFEFQQCVEMYSLDMLRKCGRQAGFHRLCLIKELDFSDIIGQRMAKQIIRSTVVQHVVYGNRGRTRETGLCRREQPLSMIFAGPSGNGKTELAVGLSKLLNKPGDDFYHKVDCGKLSDASEVFGKAGAYQGSREGSHLNNFIVRMAEEPDSFGIVLLDEIEKADRGVIHGLYQVLDKAEWTNKQLTGDKEAQTQTLNCGNIIFIMTTNAADTVILEEARLDRSLYIATGQQFSNICDKYTSTVRRQLRKTYPFTDGFIGRINMVVPFVPMSNHDPAQNILFGEMDCVAKLLIEREQDRLEECSGISIRQEISPRTKHRMARIIVTNAIVEAGVRSVQKEVETHMGNKMIHSLMLEKGGVNKDALVQYSADEAGKKIDFRQLLCGGDAEEPNRESEALAKLDDDVFG